MFFTAIHSSITNKTTVHNGWCRRVSSKRAGEVHENLGDLTTRAAIIAHLTADDSDRKITFCKCANGAK